MSESDKLMQRYENEKDPTEKAHLKAELDKMPLTSGQLDQAVEREASRKATDIKAFREKRGQ